MKIFQKQKNIKHQQGFTLLFSVLVATLVVAIGATIISIALRQTILSGTSRESQYSFYAANTALECAYYWDTTNTDLGNKVVFPAPGTTDDGINDSDPEANLIECGVVNIITGNGNDNTPWELTTSSNINTFTFFLKIQNQDSSITNLPPYEYCAEVTVTKENDNPRIITTIEAKGYNTCDPSNPRRVERGLIQQYES